MNHQALLQPLRIRRFTLRNRIVSTAHAPGYGFDSLPDERYRLYHEEKAKGGVALTMIGGSTAVSPDAVAPFGQLTAAEDRIIPPMAALAQAVHRHGAAVFCQISHPGRRGKWDGGAWLPPVAPSVVREPQHRGFPKQMEDWDFSRIRDDFVTAALRCKAAGLDGIELLFAGGHLMLQFFSPAVNQRLDEYGGSLENRMRYPLEVIRAVRQAIGDDLVMGVRITADEFIAEGLDQAECLAVATGLAGSGDVDYLSIMASQTYDWRSSAFSIPGMAFPEAPYLSLAGAIKAAVPIPVLQAAWIHDLATANRAVAEGQLDLVGMTRAQIADPHMVNKLLQGRSDDIRPCVGANYCINRIYAGAELLCVHNPATGREATMPQILRKADAVRRIVVVGGGPGGLEAARVCAARGHAVVLFEAEPECGGQIRVAAELGWRRRLGGITDWLVGQCRKHGVDLRTSVTADRDGRADRAAGCGDRRDRRRRQQGPDRGRRVCGDKLGHPDAARLHWASAFCCSTTTATTVAWRARSSSSNTARRSRWRRPSARSGSMWGARPFRCICGRCTRRGRNCRPICGCVRSGARAMRSSPNCATSTR